ncbi:MAG: hypothetical protein QOF25_5372, partial [Mycobacterium sp.]|nr:hypothetical protein [Mycobacterium sp.]
MSWLSVDFLGVFVRPTTRFARSGRIELAFQVFGEGPSDLVFVPGFASHVDLQWADPAYARFLDRLGSFARVIVYDKRGVGRSDPVRRVPTLEEHVADLRAVTSAAGSSRAVILGFSNGSPVAGLYAATYPERCLALIMCSSFARTKGREDIVARVADRSAKMLDHWGEGYGLEVFAPSLAGSRLNRTNYALFERAALRPEMARALSHAGESIDVSAALGTLDMPALVLHRRGDFIPFEAGEEVASLIAHARFVELEGSDHVPFAGDTNALLTEIEHFVRGVTENPRMPPLVAAVLFTDIVGSTERAVEVGDRRWREMIDAHDALSRAEIERHGGTAIKSTGDGWLARFDSPPQAVRAGWAISQQVERVGLGLRAGIHVGPVEVVGDDVRGITVHAAARVAALATNGQLLVSAAVVDLCAGAGIDFGDAG